MNDYLQSAIVLATWLGLGGVLWRIYVWPSNPVNLPLWAELALIVVCGPVVWLSCYILWVDGGRREEEEADALLKQVENERDEEERPGKYDL